MQFLDTLIAMLDFRVADHGDSADLLAWRNDPVSVSMSLSGEPVAPEIHERWYAAALSDPERRIVIALLGGQKAGMVRFDREGEAATVSLALDPRMRGRSLAGPVLRGSEALIMDWVPIRLVAHILAANLASRKAFESAGYFPVDGATPSEASIVFVRSLKQSLDRPR